MKAAWGAIGWTVTSQHQALLLQRLVKFSSHLTCTQKSCKSRRFHYLQSPNLRIIMRNEVFLHLMNWFDSSLSLCILKSNDSKILNRVCMTEPGNWYKPIIAMKGEHQINVLLYRKNIPSKLTSGIHQPMKYDVIRLKHRVNVVRLKLTTISNFVFRSREHTCSSQAANTKLYLLTLVASKAWPHCSTDHSRCSCCAVAWDRLSVRFGWLRLQGESLGQYNL